MAHPYTRTSGDQGMLRVEEIVLGKRKRKRNKRIDYPIPNGHLEICIGVTLYRLSRLCSYVYVYMYIYAYMYTNAYEYM